MEKVIQQRQRDCESAVINRGPYALANEFLHLQMSPDKWFSLNAPYFKKFWAHHFGVVDIYALRDNKMVTHRSNE